MLVAKDKDEKDCLAWKTAKSKKPFFCPECKQKVILRKGKIREHHFAHKVKNSCSNYVGESLIHHKCKREIYTALENYKQCTNYHLELKVGELRPDICLRVNNQPVIIEVQRSSVDVDIITKRTRYYSKKGIGVLWIIPDEKILRTKFSEKHDQIFSYPKSWQIFLHQLYSGRIYIWSHKTFVKPIHLEKFKYYVEERNWVEESPEEFHGTNWYNREIEHGYYGGYTKTSATKYRSKCQKDINNGLLNIITDFGYHTQKKWNMDNWTLPAAKLWKDTLSYWW